VSLPAHLRSLVSAASDRVRRDREASDARLAAAALSAARSEYDRLCAKYDASLVIHSRPSWEPVQGFTIEWDDSACWGWGPEDAPTTALGRWMKEQFGLGGRFAARVVAEPGTTPQLYVWVWPTYQAALAAVLALDPASAAYQARRAA